MTRQLSRYRIYFSYPKPPPSDQLVLDGHGLGGPASIDVTACNEDDALALTASFFRDYYRSSDLPQIAAVRLIRARSIEAETQLPSGGRLSWRGVWTMHYGLWSSRER